MSPPPSHADRLAAAKLWLISAARQPGRDAARDLPYLAHAVYAFSTVPSSEVPTLTCDELWRVYVNPDWLETASIPAIGAELAHLTWHLLHDHAECFRPRPAVRAVRRAVLRRPVQAARTQSRKRARPTGRLRLRQRL